jgi:hypothetical protein
MFTSVSAFCVFINPLVKNITLIHNPMPYFCPWNIKTVKSSPAYPQEYRRLFAAKNFNRFCVGIHARPRFTIFKTTYPAA